MSEYTFLYERGERNWSAHVPDLPGCIATGQTREERERLIREAISFRLDGMRIDGDPIHPPTVEAGVDSVPA